MLGMLSTSSATTSKRCQYGRRSRRRHGERSPLARQLYNELHQHPDSSGFHDKSDFPVNHSVNPVDTVHFTIGAVNWGQQYMDIYVHNPNNRIVGYQFSMSGMAISSAVSLADPIEYSITPSFTPGGVELWTFLKT